ncbi:MAG: NUDIX hydrolase [Anaerolineae bacterium]|nr:MAG: NUDIX hydrolase [Anaerolineae bacterium]
MAKIEVAAFVFIRSEEGLLLVKQNYGSKYWSLPGGSVEANETIEQAAVREVKEETGLDVYLTRVIGIYRKRSENGLAITFEGKAMGGNLEERAELGECKYFPIDGLPSHVRHHFSQRVRDFLNSHTGVVFREQ